MKEKYGFVYIWFDRKYKRYYIGCRWGREDDGYICSSTRMKNSYKRRPIDFKRRTLTKVFTNKKDLLQEEYKWLKMIKSDELGKKYYNLQNYHFNHWFSDEYKAKEIKTKISTKRFLIYNNYFSQSNDFTSFKNLSVFLFVCNFENKAFFKSNAILK